MKETTRNSLIKMLGKVADESRQRVLLLSGDIETSDAPHLKHIARRLKDESTNLLTIIDVLMEDLQEEE